MSEHTCLVTLELELPQELGPLPHLHFHPIALLHPGLQELIRRRHLITAYGPQHPHQRLHRKALDHVRYELDGIGIPETPRRDVHERCTCEFGGELKLKELCLKVLQQDHELTVLCLRPEELFNPVSEPITLEK